MRFLPIIIFIAITTISHLLLPASYHKPIAATTSYGSFPFQTQKQLHQLSQIVCTIPHFLPSPFFPLQVSCSAHLGVFILFYLFSQFPGTRFGGMECGF